MSPKSELKVWALLGDRRGDNNQVLCLARALGVRFEHKTLHYNFLRILPPSVLGPSFASLTLRSRAAVEQDLPDITISTGRKVVPVVREIRRRSNGQTKSIHLGYPRTSPALFDLVAPTPEYPVPDNPNVIRVPLALSPHFAVRLPKSAELEKFPRPLRLLLVGGPTLYWRLSAQETIGALQSLLDDAERFGGSVIVVGSPRTPVGLLRRLRAAMSQASAPNWLVPVAGPPSYPTLLQSADLIFVTADSVAMVSDAIYSLKPVGLVPIENSGLGRFAVQLNDWLRPGQRVPPRDLRFFWDALATLNHVGTLDSPRASRAPDYAQLIAEEVRRLFVPKPAPATSTLDSALSAPASPV